MYEPTPSLGLHRLSRQSLQKRYESDEEDVSESDAGGHDFVPSLVGSQRAGTIDSDLSADENSHMDPDSDREDHLLAPEALSTTKRSRPVSMDTLKRSSDADTFGDNAYVFDPEDDMVLELPSPDSTPALASSLFLKPSIYVPPTSPPEHKSRSRSQSPSSIFSVEHAEVQMAKEVTMMEPPTRPTLVFINSLGPRSKAPKSRLNHSRTRGNPRDRESRIFMPRTESTLEVPRLMDPYPSPRELLESRASSERGESINSTPSMSPLLEDETTPGATIDCVSDIPFLPYIPPSPNVRPQSMYRPRPRTPASEKSFPPPSSRLRRAAESSRQASSRSNSNSSMPSFSRPGSPFRDDIRPGYLADYSDGASLTRTCSPASIASSPAISQRSHHASKHSVSNILTQRSPMMRRMTRKHSASSSISMSSLRSEMGPIPTPAPTSASASASSNQSTFTATPYDSHVVRKTSQRRHGRHNSSAYTGKGFMGLKFGKRSFTKT